MKPSRLIITITALAALLLTVSCAGRDQDQYKVSEQTPAPFLTGEDTNVVTWDETDCTLPAEWDDSAYGYLQAIVTQGGRRTGSREYRCAVILVKRMFESMGYQTEEISYIFPYYQFDLDKIKVVRARDGKRYDAFPMQYSAPIGGEKTGRLVKPGPFADLRGNFVYLERNYLSRSDVKKEYAGWVERGAVGIIRDASLWPMAKKGLIHSAGAHAASWHYAPLPGFVVSNAKELVGEQITVSGDVRIVPGRGYDVVAKTCSDRPKSVLVTAHLDSWFEGALDDGSGVAVLLDTARRLKDDPGGVIFLAADSEEIGLFGSAVYVQDKGTADVGAVVELDMVSSLNNYTNDTPEGANVTPRVITVTRGMKPAAKQNYGGLAGRKIFVPVGVNNALFGSLATDLEWFYRAGVPGVFVYTPSYYYHTRLDTIDWIPREDINEVAAATAALVRELRDKVDELPAPAHVLKFDFTVNHSAPDQAEFQLRPDPASAKGEWGPAQARVYAYYEMGFEREVDLKRDEDGTFRGECELPYLGQWQFQAILDQGKARGKQWKTLSVWDEHPVPDPEG